MAALKSAVFTNPKIASFTGIRSNDACKGVETIYTLTQARVYMRTNCIDTLEIVQFVNTLTQVREQERAESIDTLESVELGPRTHVRVRADDAAVVITGFPLLERDRLYDSRCR